MEKLNLSKNDLLVLLIFLLIGLSSLFWFEAGKVVYFHDEVIPLIPSSSIRDYFFAWRDTVNFGEPNTGGVPKIIPITIFYLLSLIGFDIANIERLFYFFTIIFGGYSSYLFFKLINRNFGNIKAEWVAGISSVLYVLSPFIIFYIWRLNYIITRSWYFVFFPLLIWSLLSFILSIKKGERGLKYIVAFVVSAILISPSFSHPSFFLLTVAGLSISLIMLGVSRTISFKKISIIAFSAVLIFLVANLYWIVPRTFSFTDELSNAQSSIGTSTVLESNSENLKLSNSFLGSETPALYDKTPWYSWSGFYSSILFTIGAIGLFVFAIIALFKKRGVYMLFLFIYLLILSLMLGTGPPFGQFVEYLFDKLPPLQAFRDPGKWGFALLLPLYSLIGAGFYYSFTYFKSKVYKTILTMILVALVALTSWPFFVLKIVPDGYSYPNSQINIPNDYYVAASILSDNNKAPILQLPIHGTHNAAIWSGENGYKGVDILRNISGQPILDANAGLNYKSISKSFENSILEKSFDSQSIVNLMNNMGSQYIVVNLDSDPEYVGTKVPVEEYIEVLDSTSSLKKVFNSKNIVIYKNTQFKSSYIYSPLVEIQEKFDNSESMSLDLKEWTATSKQNSIVRYDKGLLKVDTSFKDDSDSLYLKNNKDLNINPALTPYLIVQTDKEQEKISVSAEDVNGNSGWLPDATKEIVKSGILKDSSNLRFYDMSNFTSNIKTLRVNLFSQDEVQEEISVKSISVSRDVFNDYTLYTSNNLNLRSYTNDLIDLDGIKSSKVELTNNESNIIRTATVTGDGKTIIAIKQKYDTNWILKDADTDRELSGYMPIRINGYQQGWLIELNNSTSIHLKIEYSIQKNMYIGYMLASSVILVPLIYLVIYKVRNRSRFHVKK